MIGPILHQELLLGSRRGRLVVLRRLYTSWLILQFSYFFAGYCWEIWRSMLAPPQGPGIMDVHASGRFADAYLATLVTQQFLLLFLLAPAFVAGALTDEKSRGTLQYLLTSSLATWEIVLGKLLGRLAHLAILALAALPILCFMSPFGGFDFLSFVGLAAALLVPLVAVGAASMLASVWSRQTRDAVIALYVVGAAGYGLLWGLPQLLAALPPTSRLYSLGGTLTRLFNLFDPMYLLEPTLAGQARPGEFARRLAGAVAAWGSIAVVCLLLAVWRLRGAYTKQLEGRPRSRRVWMPRPEADAEEPIRWKETQVEGIAPLPILRRVPRWAGLAAVFTATLLFSAGYLFEAIHPARLLDYLAEGNLDGLWTRVQTSGAASGLHRYFWLQAVVAFLAVTGVVGVRCSGAVTGERERQTWEALLLTPLPVRELIRNKVRGIIGAARPYLMAYAVPALVLSFLASPYSFFWTLLALGATLPVMHFVGATGIYYSVRSASSWKSLLATLGVGYVGGFVICTASVPIVGILSLIAFAILGGLVGANLLMHAGVGILAFIVLGWCYILWRVAERFIVDAQRLVIGKERTPYWVGGVNCGIYTEQYMKQFESPHA